MATPSFIGLPPDSTGKAVKTIQHTDNRHVQLQTIADADDPANTLAIDNRGSASVRFAEGQPIMSGFGQLKTQHDRTLGVYESSLDSYDSLFSINEQNGGESEFSSSESSTILRVTGAAGSSVKRTTNRYHYYLPGTSNYIKMTIACSDQGKPNNIRSWGAYDDNDGIFFKLAEDGIRVDLRSTTVPDVSIPRSAWNGDKLDGTGPSGMVIDLTKVNIYWIDYQWLGAGRVRFGVVEPSGGRIVCHEMENANNYNLPYMRSGTLPLRTENVNLSATGSTTELREVCMSVYCEGNYDDCTFWRAADINAEKIISSSSFVNLFTLRSKQLINGEHNCVVSFPEYLNIALSSNDPVEVAIYEGSDITGGTWLETNTSLEFNTDGVVDLTSANKIFSCVLSQLSNTVNLRDNFEINDEGIQINADGTYKLYSFVVRRIFSGTPSVFASLGYRELW